MSTKYVSLAVITGMMLSAIACIVQPQAPAPVPQPRVVPPPVVVHPVPPAPLVPPPPPAHMPPPLIAPPPGPVPQHLAPAPLVPPHPARVRGPVEMFADVRVGMPRPEIEAMLGKPMVAEVERSGIVEVWYLSPPAVVKPGVPRGGPGAIFVAYRGGRVIEKRLNPQM
jgi:hypothetical protein